MDDAFLSHSGPDRPLRVLISSYRAHPHVGGQGVYVRGLAGALAEQGCCVTVVSGPPYPEIEPPVTLVKLPALDLFTEANAFLAARPRHFVNHADRAEWFAHNTGAFGEMTAFGLRLERWLAKAAQTVDVVHDNQTLSAPIARLAKTWPVVTTLHHPIGIDAEYALEGAPSAWRRFWTRRWYGFVAQQGRAARRLDPFLAVSQASAEAYTERFGLADKIIRIAHNGIDHDRFFPDPLVRRDPNLVLAAASADVPIKGLDVAIEAFAHIADRRPEARLMVLGRLREGPTKRALEASGLGERVAFRSGLTTEDMAQAYRRAGVFVCASRFEGFGLPAAEAMACGAPVIVSNGGALPEVVGQAGIVTPVGDAKALAGALESLLADRVRAKALGEAAAQRAKTAFSWRAHAQAAIGLYREALAARAPATADRVLAS